MSASQPLPGFAARLDRLVHHFGGKCLPADRPHAFVYFITLENRTEHTLRVLGRKWVIEKADGSREVIEGDGVVGEKPVLAPGESYSYNSFHVTGEDCVAHGCIHAADETGRIVHALLPPFAMRIPPRPNHPPSC